ncbi:MAG TPA: RsmD family RNA methyltransferase, partial [Deltaproteobacteria bacterium]|nr:RsmD family RNA methyltransferase [Deltaproteobacteria bacterium]
TIQRNLLALKANEQAKVVKSDVRSFVEKCEDKFDVIFMDPPYNKGLASQLAPRVYRLLKTGGVLVIEHSPDEPIPFHPWKIRTYGDTMITYIMRDES